MHKLCQSYAPWRCPEDSCPAAGVARGVGGRRSAGRRDTRGYPVDILSDIDDTLSGEGRAARLTRERVAAAHHGSDQGRGVRVLWQEGSGGAATCSEMGRLPSSGQGHVGRAPLLAIPRLAYVLPLPEVAHHRVCRHRLARGVHYLSVARREERV